MGCNKCYNEFMNERTQQEEVERNFGIFREKLADLLEEYAGKFALMHDGEIVDFFDTAADAYKAGSRLFVDEPFSIQEVTDDVADLGYFSHVVGG